MVTKVETCSLEQAGHIGATDSSREERMRENRSKSVLELISGKGQVLESYEFSDFNAKRIGDLDDHSHRNRRARFDAVDIGLAVALSDHLSETILGDALRSARFSYGSAEHFQPIVICRILIHTERVCERSNANMTGSSYSDNRISRVSFSQQRCSSSV